MRSKNFLNFGILCLWVIITRASPCYAGMMFTLGPNWNNFMFEPETHEDTPNYYGYGGRGSLGYSFAQVIDLALYGQYTPGRMNSATAVDANASLIDYGAEFGVRMFNVLYVGVRGGLWNFHLSKRQLPDEVGGVWSGVGGEASFGLILPVNKQASWQASLDIGQADVSKTDKSATEADLKARKISRVSVTMSFVYNGYQTNSTEDALINSFLKTLF